MQSPNSFYAYSQRIIFEDAFLISSHIYQSLPNTFPIILSFQHHNSLIKINVLEIG